MNFIERMIARKEVDMGLDFIKKHWPGVLHLIAIGAIFLDPSIRTYLGHEGQAGATGIVIWAEIMRWLQSPNNVPQPKPAPTPIKEK